MRWRINPPSLFLFIYYLFTLKLWKRREPLLIMIYITEQVDGSYVTKYTHTDYIIAHNELLIKKFINVKHLEGCSHYTTDSYYIYLRKLSKSLGIKFEEMTTDILRNYLMDYMQKANLKRSTADSIRLTYNSFFRFLEEDEIIKESPMKKIHRIKQEKVIKKPFTEEEVLQMKEACRNVRERAIIDFLYSSGCRASEVCNIKLSEVDFDRREVIIHGKGSKERIVYFDAETKYHLLKYMKTHKPDVEYLFYAYQYPHKKLERSALSWIVKNVADRAGVENAYPHRFRRTIATRLLDRGMPIEQVKVFLGHAKLDTTLIYANVNQEYVRINHFRHC